MLLSTVALALPLIAFVLGMAPFRASCPMGYAVAQAETQLMETFDRLGQRPMSPAGNASKEAGEELGRRIQ